MIDTWLTAAVLLVLLALGALIRMLRNSGQHDRLLAALLTVIFGSAAGLMLCISMGSLLVLDATIIIALICCIGIIAWGRSAGGASA